MKGLKMTTARSGMLLAWELIYTGRGIWEATEPRELNWTTDRLVSLGRRLEAAGEALETHMDALAARWGLDITDVLAPLVAARTVHHGA